MGATSAALALRGPALPGARGVAVREATRAELTRRTFSLLEAVAAEPPMLTISALKQDAPAPRDEGAIQAAAKARNIELAEPARETAEAAIENPIAIIAPAETSVHSSKPATVLEPRKARQKKRMKLCRGCHRPSISCGCSNASSRAIMEPRRKRLYQNYASTVSSQILTQRQYFAHRPLPTHPLYGAQELMSGFNSNTIAVMHADSHHGQEHGHRHGHAHTDLLEIQMSSLTRPELRINSFLQAHLRAGSYLAEK